MLGPENGLMNFDQTHSEVNIDYKAWDDGTFYLLNIEKYLHQTCYLFRRSS